MVFGCFLIYTSKILRTKLVVTKLDSCGDSDTFMLTAFSCICSFYASNTFSALWGSVLACMLISGKFFYLHLFAYVYRQYFLKLAWYTTPKCFNCKIFFKLVVLGLFFFVSWWHSFVILIVPLPERFTINKYSELFICSACLCSVLFLFILPTSPLILCLKDMLQLAL